MMNKLGNTSNETLAIESFFKEIGDRPFKTTFIPNLKTLVAKEVNLAENVLKVEISTVASTWIEDWNLTHTYWGFERGEYFFISQK